MTETVLNALTPTPLAAALAAQALDTGLKLELVGYRGVLTPQHLDAAGAETDALLRGTAVHDLGWLRRVAARGEDRFRWLSGMVTNTVETLAENSGAYNLILNAQGRIQGDVHVWRVGDTVELEFAADQIEALMAHLDRFIIMDDVELAPLLELTALGVSGPGAATILTTLGLPVPAEELSGHAGELDGVAIRVERGYGPVTPHFHLWIAADSVLPVWQKIVEAGAKPVGAAAIEALRIVEGIPAYGIDIQSRDLAQETSQMRALSFTKGCYLGQEIVERIRSRGQIHRHLRSLEILPDNASDPPSAGAELQIAGKPVGTLTSVAALQQHGTQLSNVRRIFAIGMIRAEAEIAKEPLRYAGGTAKILNAPLDLRGRNAAEKIV